MTKPKWTTSDAKRAEKMGWKLFKGVKPCSGFYHEIRCFIDGPFKSDAEAIEWVMDYPRRQNRFFDETPELTTCRKAIYLCCSGGTK